MLQLLGSLGQQYFFCQIFKKHDYSCMKKIVNISLEQSLIYRLQHYLFTYLIMSAIKKHMKIFEPTSN